MVDLTKLAVQDRVKKSYRESEKDPNETCQAVCVENDISILDGGGSEAEITVGTTSVLGNVTGTNRASRKMVIFQPQDKDIYWGYNSSVTISNGIKAFKDQVVMLEIGPNTDIYFIATGAGKKIRIQELS